MKKMKFCNIINYELVMQYKSMLETLDTAQDYLCKICKGLRIQNSSNISIKYLL